MTIHKIWEFPQKDGRKLDGKTHIVEVKLEVADNEVINLQQEKGENLMMKIWLQPEKDIEKEPKQRKTLFRTKYKIEGKCYNLIIDGGNSKNLVSTEVVTKLNLKCTPHLEAYRVSWLQNGQRFTLRE